VKKIIIFNLTILLYSCSFGQTSTELYNSKNYQELVKLEKKADILTPDELYMVGFAFFQLENDAKAIQFYDKAINKGLDSAYVHYQKGLSLRYSKHFEEAITEFNIAIKKQPTNQMFMSEKGFVYYYSGQFDKALLVFLEAQKLPNEIQAPFYMVPHIYQHNMEFDKALKGFYEGLNHISKDNECYISTLTDIGKLEFTVTKDFSKSAKAYLQAINLAPKNYELYPKLIKAYNAEKEYSKADSVFSLMKIAYKNKELSEEEMKYKNIPIDEYDWNGQKVTVYKYLEDPKESLDISYNVYLLTKAGDKIERTFMVEKTIRLPDGVKHLLCEKDKKSGSHITYPYGWHTDTISLEDIKKAMGLVLDGKMKQAASSNFGDK